MNNNKNIALNVIVYAFIVALIYSFATSGFFSDTSAFNWTKFIITGLISWVVIIILSYVLYIIIYSKVTEQQVPQVVYQNPTIKYYYHPYSNGFCRVEKITFYPDGNVSSEFNFFNKEGEYISEKWYPGVSDFCADGVALVTDGEMYNFINSEGKIMSTNWFYGIDPFSDGVAKVKWKDNTVNFVGIDGKCLWKEWKPEVVLPNSEENTNEDNNEEN